MEANTKIQDFGSKIGGARKDMNITRKEKSTETTPQWMRAYSVISEKPKFIIEIANKHTAGTGSFFLIWNDPNKKSRFRIIAEGFPTEADALDFIPAAEVLRTLKIVRFGDSFSVYRVF